MLNYSKSEKAFKEAKKVLPGGVNSPVRAFNSVDATPVFMDHGKGAYITDIDGNEYIDYVLSWGPLILGHANPSVVDAITKAAMKGTSFGTPTEIETELAKLVIERVPSIEIVRMVSSGTEATMSAIRLARGYTKREKILKFEGSYHGHGDSLLIKAGSGVATLGLPDSPGVTKGLAADTITVPYNDVEGAKLAFEKYGEEIAAVIVEPVAGNMGVVPPIEGFLEGLRDLTTKYGALLIFDEVMTGFRVDYYSAQGYYVVTPDITCLGKVIGGGLPVGAYGGKKEIMEQIAPAGSIYQAGTLSGNPLAMNAGFETVRQLTPQHYDVFRSLIKRMEEGLTEISTRREVPISINKAGSMFGFFFTDQKVINFDTAKTSNLEFFRNYYREMLNQGIFLPPSQFEGVFISTMHTEKEIDKTLEAFDHTCKTLRG
ncbi:glutamate-1-semialdehyde 2,1-aminomutase [Listeria welshimeri]|uniref:Glutamate-1-semialdehyde 2,1-aminomutase 1 n=1 Tax=Listeria welshimeri serovar 6b (strain ATCC 35897 / DSM 20650 / CCUG 15529 / CIP 8149 / NCTC 11857 / SLCC 5334 / V8) TaxID=386043 RepID=GSA1_LISW6|nr:glutamate-1-semialdehyde 2,1-aminomutase [Listeria welshimeri]A0AJ02.1 RecName: Full=Glutamate-1-semialdehyde 2,1-aminomutase 1; Short=GSA 1; AltName: Full=Glutamate-1-semialdehyde aminotransferase 1; Short=GSA-AT 1 [Listeria welshimeri serovar 6b str. SLCC5334]MBC1243557.1 glutamate-1-semialdehyde 2,1-aminomutase [Listeria welshimeri]MBC1252046.1 glutamate-1-semialdehyde 2,1-aminomutase [Listeria welshimeri]MBC1281566.1 glutamate-1-semialdehyde 2,1-aminomutase [Listeria welshimeri]MBC14110